MFKDFKQTGMRQLLNYQTAYKHACLAGQGTIVPLQGLIQLVIGSIH